MKHPNWVSTKPAAGQYAGLQSSQVREFKQLSEENARLKKLVAELSLDKAVLQDVLSKKFPGQRS